MEVKDWNNVSIINEALEQVKNEGTGVQFSLPQVIKIIELTRDSLTAPEEDKEEKCIDIDFNGNLLTRVKIKNNRLEFTDAMNGFGDPVDVSKIEFRKV